MSPIPPTGTGCSGHNAGMPIDDRPGHPEPQAPELDQPKPRRSRWDLVLALVCVALLVAAAVAVAGAHTASSQAGTDRSQAATLHHQRAAVAAKTSRDTRVAQSIDAETAKLAESLQKLGTDLGAESDAQNHFVDVANQSADSFNQGSISTSVSLLETQGQAALADVNAKQAMVDTDLVTTQAAIAHLEGALHG
jgi:Skp family chaperone for outer membrane proteins